MITPSRRVITNCAERHERKEEQTRETNQEWGGDTKQDAEGRSRDTQEGQVSLGRSWGKAAGSTEGQHPADPGEGCRPGAAPGLPCEVHCHLAQDGGQWDQKKGAETLQMGRVARGFHQVGQTGPKVNRLRDALQKD